MPDHAFPALPSPRKTVSAALQIARRARALLQPMPALILTLGVVLSVLAFTAANLAEHDRIERAGWIYLVFGLLLSLAIAGYVASEQRRREAVERVVAERTEELGRTSEQIKAIIDASPQAIIGLNPSQRVILWSGSAERMFGYTAQEALGGPPPTTAPEDVADRAARFRNVAAGGVHRNFESRHIRKDGTVLETRVSAGPFYDSTGNFQGIVLIVEDTTDHNQIQRQLQQAQKMEAIGQLTGGMAHDFNNLLGIILGNVDLLAERFAAGTEERELADAAVDAATRWSELNRQLLAFARRQILTARRSDPAAVLVGTAQLMRRTLGESVTVALRLAEDLWPVMIDVSQLESAILNLGVNARDAMPAGGSLIIEASNTVIGEEAAENPEASPGEYVVISVSDTGTGIPDDILAKVFDPFFTTKGATGSGLGLSMVHGFVRQSGGYTKIYSELGRGTTVRVYLPRAAMASGADAKAEDAVATAAKGREVILVVEDNAGMRDIAVRQLQSFGYRTIPAHDGGQALEMLRGGAPVDLLFTDVIMPGGIDGRDLAAAARQLRPDLKILFTSGFTGAAASAAVRDDLANHLLSKPYRKDQLARRVRASLDASECWFP